MVRAHASRADGIRFESDCSPSSEWVPGDNNGEIMAARKGTGHPTSYDDGSG